MQTGGCCSKFSVLCFARMNCLAMLSLLACGYGTAYQVEVGRYVR